MMCSKNKQRWVILGGVILATVLVLCAWMFGWFGGAINVMDFSAAEVDRIDLTCTDPHVDLYKAVVTEKNEIQALINSVNSFQHTGSGIKSIFKGNFMGGGTLYNIDVYLLNGENIPFRFASGSGEEVSNIEGSYWIYDPDSKDMFGSTCRGSLETFYELYEKYRPTK